MLLYTLNKERKKYNTDKIINSGTFGEIYLIQDKKSLKIFKEPIKRTEKCFFQEDTYNEIKKLKLQNFYELYDLYYNSSLTKILGYLSKYYQKEDIDILTMPVYYTLDNLYKLYNSFKKLSEHNIYTDDVHSNNVIMNSNNIIIIDTDLYYKSSNEKKDVILKENLYNLSDLFIDIYLSSLDNYNKCDRILMAEKIQRLFLINSTYGIEPITRKLTKYKYPIDYLRKR